MRVRLNETYLVEIMRSIGQGCVHANNNSFDFITTSPFGIARMLVYPPHILAYLWIDGLEYKVVDRIQRIRKDELGPSKDPKFITR